MMGDKSVIADMCEGVTEAKISCIDQHIESSKKEKFHFLQLDIEGCQHLIECIEKFICVEFLTGDNMYEANDKIKRDAYRSLRFEKIPSLLFVQLKRFKYDSTDLIKMNNKVEYPERIDLSSYYSTKTDDIIHRLYGVIVHDGMINSGHYYVFIKDFNKNQWLKFNDAKVTIVSEEEVFEKNFGGFEEDVNINSNCDVNFFFKENPRTAYMLIYVQEDKIKMFFNEVKNSDVIILK